MTIATAATTTTSQVVLAAGTVVRAPRYIDGKNTGLRKAVVLGLFNENDPKGGYRVYFYTLGPAGFDRAPSASPSPARSPPSARSRTCPSAP